VNIYIGQVNIRFKHLGRSQIPWHRYNLHYTMWCTFFFI